MTTYAICDRNAGLLQGVYEAETIDDAIKAHAVEVGLIEEIDLAMLYATVTEAEKAELLREEFPESIEWSTIPDERVRDILGFDPRAAD